MRKIEVTPELVEWLVEALVIGYEYRREENTFALVTEFWDKSPGSDHEFIQIVCHGVREFVRKPGLYSPVQRFVDRYSLRENVGTYVLQLATMKPVRDGWRFRISLGRHQFGEVHFKCSHVTGKARGSIARKVDGEWRYYSLETGEPFDFYAPFG